MRSLVCLVAAFAIGGCNVGGSRAPAESELYLVRARGADTIAPTTERAMIRVAPVDIAAHIRGIAIVTNDGRVRTMVNQGFAAPLHGLVEDAVTDRLRASGRYGVVLSPAHPSAAPFVLRLTLRAFEVVVMDTGYVARVVFDGLVEREADRKVVRAFRAGAERATEGPAGGGFVRGLEDALNGAIDVILQELEAAGIGGVAPLLQPEAEPPAERTG
jgi:ABC-type uncharacterized transport system auxiliary subunit